MLPDGRIEFLGRIDTQVKIRGHRVEAGEVEAQLSAVPGIADAVVVLGARPDGRGRILVAHCVPAADARPSAAELRDHLARALPEYMIPARYVFTDRLPLTPSGKVDRRALEHLVPNDQSAPRTEPVPPRETPSASPEATRPEAAGSDEIAEKIAALWQELLGSPPPAHDVSMFELGGDSLTATSLAARIEELFGPIVPVAELFSCNTVAAQAALVERLVERELGEYSPDEVALALHMLNDGGTIGDD
jgi:acyl carrier protein